VKKQLPFKSSTPPSNLRSKSCTILLSLLPENLPRDTTIYLVRTSSRKILTETGCYFCIRDYSTGGSSVERITGRRKIDRTLPEPFNIRDNLYLPRFDLTTIASRLECDRSDKKDDNYLIVLSISSPYIVCEKRYFSKELQHRRLPTCWTRDMPLTIAILLVQ